MLQPGRKIDGRYEILKEIGRGGMSIVYLAHDDRLNKSLVVKDIFKRENSNDKLLLQSLEIEWNMLKKLDHGALPKIYDIIDSGGDILVVMDYIEGESLKQMLQREKVAEADDVIDWAKQLTNVLGYLHTRKPYPIIYRDMKPDNVMLTPDGKVKLIDFGIAREYKTENTTDTRNLGTALYAAPEQNDGRQTDIRSDIYSLGVTLYHLVTGRTKKDDVLRPIRYWNQTLPEGLEYIISKCTEDEPDNRYQSCEELLYDLENINKLTKGYKNQLMRKLTVFLMPAVLTLALSTTSVLGYQGMKNEQFQDYMKLVNESSIQLINGEEAKAIELLELAITTVDSKKADAYIKLLDIYINRNETDAGLTKIETYIKDGYGKTNENNELLFKVGMTYFDIKRDFSTALTYFQKIDEEELPEAKYYKSLATTMSTLNIDYEEFAQELIAFEKYNDQLPNDSKKIDNYNSLATIYISYKGQIPEANTHTIKLVQKSQEVLTRLENEQLDLKYEVDFAQKLAQAFYSRGINSKDASTARKDFEQAIEYYNTLLDLEVTNQEEVLVKIGVIYSEMGESSRAIEQFESTIKNYPNSTDSYVSLGNLLLDIEQSKAERKRNYTKAKQTYEQARKLEGSNDDEALKKLGRRLDNLNVFN